MSRFIQQLHGTPCPKLQTIFNPGYSFRTAYFKILYTHIFNFRFFFILNMEDSIQVTKVLIRAMDNQKDKTFAIS